MSAKALFQFLRRYLGLIVLAGVMLFAAVRVAHNQWTYEAPDVLTIRLCHWQLESGVREAFARLMREYERLYFKKHGKRLRVIQVPVSERGYAQYVNTGLVGNIAPDIIEKGHSKAAYNPAYVARFFLPLARYLDEPNPYNKGTPLEGVPWKNTFFDGMQGAYDRQLLDYYYIPFSMFTIRIFYNVDLYKKIIGHRAPPADFRAFLGACEQIRRYAERTGTPIVPIAGSKYGANVFRPRYETPFLFDIIRKCDENLDGTTDAYEAYRGYRRGVWNFNSPAYLASRRCRLEIARNFQAGWLAALRDDAAFMFIQQRAVMIATGSWDARSLVDQVGKSFEIGIFDFPIPVRDPEYGQYVKGPLSEAGIRGGIPMAITKQSRHADICIDFLRFCTTRRNNETWNRAVTWLPVIRGTRLSPILEAFKPKIRGYYGWFDYRISTAVKLKAEGYRWSLFAGKITPEEYGRVIGESYERTGAEGYRELLHKDALNIRNLERILDGLTVRLAVAPPKDVELSRAKVTQLLESMQYFTFMNAVNRKELAQVEAVAGGPAE
ncbi:MAG: extracellular solute-binding protein [Kiritimatiellaeota bacterium]|nr:extracellular solute-binding protein [Kiritimatiellota bacterium]